MCPAPRLSHRSTPSLCSARSAQAFHLFLATCLFLLTVTGPASAVPVAQAANSPSTLTGLRLWLDASDPDGDNNAGNNPADGAALNIWHDKSGNSNNAIIAAGQNAGTYKNDVAAQINGAPVVRFTRNHKFLGSIYSVPGVDVRAGTMSDVTIFTVYRLADNSDPETALWGTDNGNWDRFFYVRHTAFGDGVDDGIAGLGPVQQGAVVSDAGQSGVVRLLTAVYDGTVSGVSNSGPLNGSTIYFDGQIVTRFTDSTQPTDGQNNFFLGWDGDDSPFMGDIAEVLVYDRALSGSEVAEVNQYLSEKYNKSFQAAAPGGVSDPASNNPKLWLRADAGVTGSSNVSTWADQGPANRSATSSDGPSLMPASVNGNPVLRFNGNSDQLTIAGGIFGGNSYTGGELYVVARANQAQNGTVVAEQVAPGSVSAALPYGDGTARWNAGSAALQASWGGQTGQPYLWSMRNGAAGDKPFAIYRNGALLTGDQSSGSFTGTNQDLVIGRNFAGDIAEVAIYGSALTAQQHARVQSYLALKYGISLEDQDYTASDDTVIWGHAANSSFSNSIAGIGKDKGSALEQLASRSVDDGVLWISASPSSVADKAFLVWGDNDAPLAATSDVPAGYAQRLQRVWRVQETGETGPLTTVSFDLTGVAGVNFNQSSQFALLTDSDTSFANATIVTGATPAGNTIMFSGVNLQNGSYLTLAYPVVALGVNAPAQGDHVGPRPSFSGTADASSTIEVREGGNLLCQATALTDGSWTCTPAGDLADGDHTVVVTATSGGSISADVSRTFTVDATTPDAPVLSAPAANAALATPRPVFSGTAEPSSTVEVRNGTTLVCQTTARLDGTWSCTPATDLPDGMYTVGVTATDSGNHTSAVTSRSFTVDTKAPKTPVVDERNSGTPTGSRPTFQGTGEPGATITVRNGDKVLCTATVQPDGNWSCTSTVDLLDGTYQLTIVARDSAGSESPPLTITITVKTKYLLFIPFVGQVAGQD
jgi:hypothetical protein